MTQVCVSPLLAPSLVLLFAGVHSIPRNGVGGRLPARPTTRPRPPGNTVLLPAPGSVGAPCSNRPAHLTDRGGEVDERRFLPPLCLGRWIGEAGQGYTIQNGWKRIPERGHFVARRETQSTQASEYVVGALADAAHQRDVSEQGCITCIQGV